jgi:uncharacterized membrane protein YoaK (UPF0700 family)
MRHFSVYSSPFTMSLQFSVFRELKTENASRTVNGKLQNMAGGTF